MISLARLNHQVTAQRVRAFGMGIVVLVAYSNFLVLAMPCLHLQKAKLEENLFARVKPHFRTTLSYSHIKSNGDQQLDVGKAKLADMNAADLQ